MGVDFNPEGGPDSQNGCKQYSPDYQAMGDCRNCGHTQDAHLVGSPEQKVINDMFQAGFM